MYAVASASTVLHLSRDVNAPARACIAAFRSTRLLTRWYDAKAELSAFRVGGRVTASYFPGYEIVALVPDQLIVQRYTSTVDGIGLWSFTARGKSTRIELHHIADGNVGVEVPARTFHWQGLIENLAAVLEKRPVPFVTGHYVGKLPRGVKYATVRAAIDADAAALSLPPIA